MTETQTPPPASDPASAVAEDGPAGIERREMLSPVSPHPVHVSQPSTIPVLKNQMDPAFNSTDAHVHENAAAPEALSASAQQQQLVPALPPAITPTPMMDTSDALASAASTVAVDNGPPGVAAGDALSGSMPGNGAFPPAAPANGFAAPATTMLPNAPAFHSSVDLQALLTKLSPRLPAQLQQQQLPAPGSAPNGILPPPPATPGGAQALTSPTQLAPGVQPSEASPLISKPPPAPITHPLPRPPPPTAPSAVPAHIAAGYPASLPPPPSFSHQHKKAKPASDEDDEETRPFTVDEEEEYSRFLSDERDYVTQGQWDRFPVGSRLFIGNLPTEKVTKRDLFHVFNKHGRLAQVSIKQAYGFVQFLTQESCAAALREEQGATVRGRKMHLEISKPQRNTRGPAADAPPRRRSRSPAYNRGGSPRRGGGSSYRGGGREVDRFRGSGERRGSGPREREDYDDRRSPAPRFGERDDYRPRRSRSRTPPRRYRPRSRSPPTVDPDEVPLPRRNPSEVPEVQILVSDELDRNFIWWVEGAFRARGLTCDMLFLNPRLQLTAVVKRQVLEGVSAVVFLNRQMQQASKIVIQVFKRRGHEQAQYDQYDNLDPPIAAELVVREKQASQASMQPAPVTTYGGYGGSAMPQQTAMSAMQQQAPAVSAAAAVPNITSLLGTLDPSTLSRVFQSLQQQQQQAQHQQQQAAPLDLSTILGGAGRQQAHTPSNPQHQSQNPYAAFAQSPGLAALLGRAQQQQQQQQQPQVQSPIQATAQQGQPGQMQNIMETLAKWKQS